MGQDTFVNLGITVSYNLNFENITIIKKIYELEKFDTYISGLHSCDDEISSLDNNYLIDTEQFENILYSNNLNEIEEKIKKYKNIKINFIYGCCSAYARNISRRFNPSIFKQEDISISEIIESLNYSKNLLIEIGVPLEKIKFGYNFFDSF